MSTTLDQSACDAAGQSLGTGLLPATPYTALQYHFGMLLGVDDLESAQAYPRGKMRLHNAWLHGEGVVWGFGVSFNTSNQLSVAPGLALDAAGHELHLESVACLDVGKWFGLHKDDPGLNATDSGTGKKFTAHVVASFKACLTRPVPSIAETCVGSGGDVAYSRVFETVDLFLRAGPAPQKDRGYHRLRVLFQVEDDSAAYADVKTMRDAIQALPVAQQPKAYLDAFRKLAARDEIDLLPQHTAAGDRTSIFPEDPTELTLAEVDDIIVTPDGSGGWTIATPVSAVNVAVRPTLVPTFTIEELLCGPDAISAPPTGPTTTTGTGPALVHDAGGPRFERASVSVSGQTITLGAAEGSVPLAAASVDPRAFDVTSYTDSTGWATMDVRGTGVDATGMTVSLALREAPASKSRLRIVARGTGPVPILGTNYVPLAGATDDAPGTSNDGHDFVHMLTIGS